VNKIVCIIPARLESTRFPRKILKNLAGKPILQWSWEAASRVGKFDSVVFAIDAQETAELIESFGGSYIMTSKDCASGTDRLVELSRQGKIEADIWVNWQADEPFISGDMIGRLLSTCDERDADVWTLKKRIKSEKDVMSPNIVKLVCDVNDYALYFSRSAIPFYRDEQERVFYKHIGLYAYTSEALKKISLLRESDLEIAERLEHLRFLQYGLKIKVHETNEEVVGIDTREDLLRAEEFVKNRSL